MKSTRDAREDYSLAEAATEGPFFITHRRSFGHGTAQHSSGRPAARADEHIWRHHQAFMIAATRRGGVRALHLLALVERVAALPAPAAAVAILQSY